MKRMIWVLIILTGFVISGCATEQGSSGGGWGSSSGHQGQHH